MAAYWDNTEMVSSQNDRGYSRMPLRSVRMSRSFLGFESVVRRESSYMSSSIFPWYHLSCRVARNEMPQTASPDINAMVIDVRS